MINFSGTKRLYAKGICNVLLLDVTTGDVKYQSNKFNTGNITTSVTMGEIRAGLGNPIAAIIPSDSALNVEFTAADFSLWEKAAQVGASISYNAPVPTCQTITATSSALSIDVESGAPVAQLGYSKPFCQVQEIGKASDISTDGVAYEVDPSSGAIQGFTATSGTQYKVWYFVRKTSAQMATLSSMFDPQVVHFVAQVAVYANEGGAAQNEGTRQGWLYIIVPNLKLGANANITGDQSNNDTTIVTGQAIAYDESVVSETCSDCDSSVLAYYVYSPDNAAQDITGIVGEIGGVVSVTANETAQINSKFVMANGQLVPISDYSNVTYEFTTEVTGSTVSNTGLITAGATAGDGEVQVEWTDGETTYSDFINVSVVSA